MILIGYVIRSKGAGLPNFDSCTLVVGLRKRKHPNKGIYLRD